MDVGDIFQTFKAVHVERPAVVTEASLHLLPDCLPYMQGIALPETGNMLNISMGVPRHLFDRLPEELKSTDVDVVADYVQRNFKAFPLVDYHDFAKQWTDQRWNRTGQVHCNFYHSTDVRVVLMGDAAHATSPSIGMGMNTALRDAQTFYRLLQEYDDDLEAVLPEFSARRVKEGNSLTDLAMHLYCMDTKAQFVETVHMVVRTVLHRLVPSIVDDHPQAMIGRVRYDLRDVYQQATKLGILSKHRRINNAIRLSYFEETTGMIPRRDHHGPRSTSVVVAVVAAVAVAVGSKMML
jgi:kynurenine 3-monooxygenase